MHVSPTLNGSSAIRRFERSNAVEIRDGITFDFYTGLPHMYVGIMEEEQLLSDDWYYLILNVHSGTSL